MVARDKEDFVRMAQPMHVRHTRMASEYSWLRSPRRNPTSLSVRRGTVRLYAYPYSSRNADMGSIRAALRAGQYAAMAVAAVNVITAPIKWAGSLG